MAQQFTLGATCKTLRQSAHPRNASTILIRPKTSAYVPLTHVIASAPAAGFATSTTPNRIAMMTPMLSAHSWLISLRHCIAVTIAKIPRTIAHTAMR